MKIVREYISEAFKVLRGPSIEKVRATYPKILKLLDGEANLFIGNTKEIADYVVYEWEELTGFSRNEMYKDLFNEEWPEIIWEIVYNYKLNPEEFYMALEDSYSEMKAFKFNESERSGPEWEALKRTAAAKRKVEFNSTFKIIPGLILSKLDYIENPELGDKNNYEFINDGSPEELPQYSEGELMGEYKDCYSFIHTESGNAYYAKKEDVKLAPEGRMIDVYRVVK